MERMNKDEYFLRKAELTASQSTCLRRQVGCIFVNNHYHEIATGYNGVASKMPHCNEKIMAPVEVMGGGIELQPYFPHACPGAKYTTTQGLEKCEAIHAEQNALLQCSDVWKIEVAYITDSPCMHCVKLLANTSCQRLVFRRIYDEKPLEYWTKTLKRRYDRL